MGLFGRILTNLEDVRDFGPAFVLRHLARARKDRIARVNARGVAIHVRAGDSDVAAVRQVFARNEYNIGLKPLAGRVDARYREILAAGQVPVVIDAGANIGAATLWFKRKYPQAAVVAIEPDPGNAALLRRNVAGLDQVRVMEAAIGARAGFVSLMSGDGDKSWAVQTQRAETGVPIVTIQDALAQVPDGAPFIAKIDIEGFEKDLFSENIDWIDDMAEVVIEPHDWMLPGQYSSAAFQQAFGARRFEMLHRGENILYIR